MPENCENISALLVDKGMLDQQPDSALSNGNDGSAKATGNSTVLALKFAYSKIIKSSRQIVPAP